MGERLSRVVIDSLKYGEDVHPLQLCHVREVTYQIGRPHMTTN